MAKKLDTTIKNHAKRYNTRPVRRYRKLETAEWAKNFLLGEYGFPLRAVRIHRHRGPGYWVYVLYLQGSGDMSMYRRILADARESYRSPMKPQNVNSPFADPCDKMDDMMHDGYEILEAAYWTGKQFNMSAQSVLIAYM